MIVLVLPVHLIQHCHQFCHLVLKFLLLCSRKLRCCIGSRFLRGRGYTLTFWTSLSLFAICVSIFALFFLSFLLNILPNVHDLIEQFLCCLQIP
uniref:Uncharacterized protein n=1 Tax=Arundo donax TaxID=35708 RepID=A0A0A9DPM5_ARUDO